MSTTFVSKLIYFYNGFLCKCSFILTFLIIFELYFPISFLFLKYVYKMQSTEGNHNRVKLEDGNDHCTQNYEKQLIASSSYHKDKAGFLT